MYLVSLSRRPQSIRTRAGESVQSVSAGRYWISFLYGGGFVRYENDPPGIWIEPHGAGGADSTRVAFDADAPALRIQKGTGAGAPVYYTKRGDGEFYCASHPGLFARVGLPLEEDGGAIPELIVYGYVMPPRTLFKGVRTVPAGAGADVRLDGPISVTVRKSALYGWVLAEKEPVTESAAELVAERLRETIAGIPRGRQPICLLSGGLDSSILYKVCRDVHGLRESYSTAYPFRNGDGDGGEEEYARTASASLGSRHTFYRSEAGEYLPALLESIEAAGHPPHHKQSAMFHLMFRNLFEGRGGVIMCGEGADALFGNLMFQHYVRRLDSHRNLYRFLSSPLVDPLLDRATRAAGRGRNFYSFVRRSRGLRAGYDDPNSILWNLGEYASMEWVCSHFGVEPDDVVHNRREAVRPIEGAHLQDAIAAVQCMGDVTITKTIWSALGEASGNMLLYPFNGMELMKLAFRYDWESKMGQPKKMLRDAAKIIGIPEYIIDRPKLGFLVKRRSWALPGGAFEPLADMVSDAVPRETLRELQRDDAHMAHTFWNLVTYGLWKRISVNGESAEDLKAELRAFRVRGKSMQLSTKLLMTHT